MKTLFSLLLTLIMISPAHATKYELDASHMQVGFKVAHLVIATVNGHFKKFNGTFDFNEKTNELSGVDVKIDIDSIDTNEPDRDAHLKSDDFFGVRKDKGKGAINTPNQYMTFKSSEKHKIKKGKNKINGTLSIGQQSRPVTLDVDFKGSVTDPWGNKKVVFNAKTKINRQQFGLKWSKKLDTGGVVVGDDVEIIIEGEANAKSEGKGA